MPAPMKAVVQLALARLGGLALRLTRRRVGLVLVYHAISLEQGDPARELVPAHSVASLEAQLQHLERRYRIVRPEQLPEAVERRQRGGRFPVALTFDDDLASHVTLAAPVLGRHRVPATFFLTGAALERAVGFWWQRLQRAADEGLPLPLPGGDVHEVAAKIERLTGEEQDRIGDELGALVGVEGDEPGLRAEGVRQLVAAGFDIGFHTRHHRRLPELDDAELHAALREGRGELEAVAGRALDAISYPHGRADPRVAEAARAAGFERGFTGRYGPVTSGSDLLLLGRIEPSFDSLASFATQLVEVLSKRDHS